VDSYDEIHILGNLCSDAPLSAGGATQRRNSDWWLTRSILVIPER
jgi:hypothetical protein